LLRLSDVGGFHSWQLADGFPASIRRPSAQVANTGYDQGQPDGVELSDGIPAYDTMPPLFMIKLVLSWVAMGFRRPKITW
jgi:hypothetical protein